MVMLKMIVIYAHWCPICNMMRPIAEEIEADYRERLSATWIDVDEHPDVIEEYEREIVPTFILYRKEKEVARMAGMISEDVLRERIDDEEKNRI